MTKAKKATSRKTPARKTSAKKVVAKKPGKTSRSSGLSAAQFHDIALGFPGAHAQPSYGQPAIFILKKFFTRLRREDNSAVLRVGSIDERDMLLAADPALFHITDHYRNYPIVLARLEKLDAEMFTRMLKRIWLEIAPKKLVKEQSEIGP